MYPLPALLANFFSFFPGILTVGRVLASKWVRREIPIVIDFLAVRKWHQSLVCEWDPCHANEGGDKSK